MQKLIQILRNFCKTNLEEGAGAIQEPPTFNTQSYEQISKYVTWKEATKSQTAVRLQLDNTPKNPSHILNMRHVAETIFDPVREFNGGPLYVSSFYRSIELNEAIGGSPRSQHCKGEAIDLDADVYGGKTNQEIFEFIRDNLDFDQLIHEFGEEENPAWVHVSCKYDTQQNRGSILRAYKENGVTKYKKWL